ncbi:MAG: nucleotide-binding protein [Thermodesulfobacteriota bacterium]|nr:nucleotide-binding protein [Thermodesulfobacteriota bacterium]
MTAASQGLTIPRYIKIKAQLYEIYNPYHAFISLLRNINSLLSYLELTNVLQRKEEHGDRIFIGHGGSNVWKEIKDFLHEKLGLSWDEFDRVSTAGLATVERISDMLSSAQFAFIIFTSEDEYADESLHARENVIHEAGLFQGKLGFRSEPRPRRPAAARC